MGMSLNENGAATVSENELTVELFHRSDLGSYTCIANFNNYTESHTFEIDENALHNSIMHPIKPELPIVKIFVQVDQTMPIVLGQEFHMMCVVDGKSDANSSPF